MLVGAGSTRWGDYPTYDCAHLESAPAVRFSEGLALEIERVLGSRTEVSRR